MNQQEYQRRLLERESRYPGWQVLAPNRVVHIHVDCEYARSYAGQVAAITAASIVGRMSQSVSIDVPSLPVLAPLPWASARLDEVVMQTLKAADRYGNHQQRPAQSKDLRLVVGASGDGILIHGCGWGAYYGNESSPIEHSDEPNPFGAAFAVIAAASQLHKVGQNEPIGTMLVDTYSWKTGLSSAGVPRMSTDCDLGEVWCIGVGSVGSCALFFLSLVTSNFHAVLVDRDTVEIENVRRSALFSSQDASNEEFKVEVARRWLYKAGVERIESHIAWLDEIPDRWHRREMGTPDILISAANERNVRSEIESGFPPIQVYATTGRKLASDFVPSHSANWCLLALRTSHQETTTTSIVCNRFTCPGGKQCRRRRCRPPISILRCWTHDLSGNHQAQSHWGGCHTESSVLRASRTRHCTYCGTGTESWMLLSETECCIPQECHTRIALRLAISDINRLMV